MKGASGAKPGATDTYMLKTHSHMNHCGALGSYTGWQ